MTRAKVPAVLGKGSDVLGQQCFPSCMLFSSVVTSTTYVIFIRVHSKNIRYGYSLVWGQASDQRLWTNARISSFAQVPASAASLGTLQGWVRRIFPGTVGWGAHSLGLPGCRSVLWRLYLQWCLSVSDCCHLPVALMDRLDSPIVICIWIVTIHAWWRHIFLSLPYLW